MRVTAVLVIQDIAVSERPFLTVRLSCGFVMYVHIPSRCILQSQKVTWVILQWPFMEGAVLHRSNTSDFF